MTCEDMGTSNGGSGGRIADALSMGDEKYVTSSFSLAGSAVWPKGAFTQRIMVDERNQERFREYEMWRDVLTNVTEQRHGNPYADVFAHALRDSVLTTEKWMTVLEESALKTNYRTNTGLERQLQKVASLIGARVPRAAERDLFFVEIGGWDMHRDLNNGLVRRFREIDDALRGFVAEMKAQDIWNSVLFFTESEFARTLDSNGEGSDHAWAGIHFLIGGAVKGGNVFNRFHASLAAGNADDLGRGRMVPHYPWESVLVPIAEWLGMDKAAQGATAFPYLTHFNASHIITKEALFKPGF